MQVSSGGLKRDCSLQFGGGGVAVAAEAQNAAERAACFRIIWSNSHGLARLRLGIFQLPLLSERVGKIDVRLREIGLQAQRNAKLRDCRLNLPLGQKHPAQGVVRLGAVGCELDYLFESGARAREIALLQRCHSTPVD